MCLVLLVLALVAILAPDVPLLVACGAVVAWRYRNQGGRHVVSR